MRGLTLDDAVTIATSTLEKGRELGYKPLTVAVLDAGGHVKVVHRDDGASLLRPDIAIGKARGALGMGLSSRDIANLAAERPQFAASLAALAGGNVVPAAGGVLVKDEGGDVIGAVGASGDTSDADEECVLHGIAAAGLSSS
jgi:uncharacterized protein GlcG (DUF336 family)